MVAKRVVRILALLVCAPALAAPLDFADIAVEGELRWLAERPDPGAYHYRSDVYLTAESLATGLVTVETCHLQLDPNPRVVIVFNPERVQRVQVRRVDGVGEVQAAGHRVDLRDVQRGATVCIGLQSRLLDPQGNTGRWRLLMGPLMRRYLDGYLPMEANVHLHWPERLLEWVASEPPLQTGVSLLRSGVDGAHLRLVFAGRMTGAVELQSPPALRKR